MTTSANDATVHSWSKLVTDRPMALLERQRVIGEQMMVSRVLLSKGCDVPTHKHVNEQMSIVLSGRVRFGFGEVGSESRREVEVGAGEIVKLPAWVPHSAYAIEDTLILDMFSPPSATTGIDEAHKR